MALDAYALTTLVAANYELGLTSDSGAVDAHVENLINQASDTIENALNRKFKIRLYTKERHSGNDQEILYFDQYPVVAVNLDNLVWDAAGKKVTRNDGGSFIKDGFADGNKVLVQNSDLNGGLLTIEGVVDALFITFSDVIVDDALDDNVIISHCRELWVNDSELDEDDFEVNEDHIYYNTGFSKGHENIRVTYYAGYVIIPDDIEAYCLKLIKMAYENTKDIKSEKLGPYSVTFFDNKAELTDMIRNDLSTYINVGAV